MQTIGILNLVRVIGTRMVKVGGYGVELSLTDKALEHIQKKGGKAAIDLICVSN